MSLKNDVRYSFIVYIAFASLFFITGCILCYLIPEGSFFYSGLKNTLVGNLKDTNPLSVYLIASAFAKEIKYIFFALASTFTAHKQKLFPLLIAYRSLLNGSCSSCLIKEIKLGTIKVDNEIFGCFIFIVSTVGALSILCLLCASSLKYSEKLIYPAKLTTILKRKDTYLFLLDFLSCCGAVLLLIIIKQWSLYLMLF